ncbi:hypothetical protein C7212DRAFT_316124, partial [Tuber magnatum]
LLIILSYLKKRPGKFENFLRFYHYRQLQKPRLYIHRRGVAQAKATTAFTATASITLSFLKMCKLIAHNYTLCNHKIWSTKQACSQAIEDATLPYPGCESFPITARTFSEPPSEAVVDTRYYHMETCQLLGCRYTVRPEMVVRE